MSLIPSLGPLIASSNAVKAIIGSNPVRFYPQGAAPQNAVAPYVTQSVVDTVPLNTLSELPAGDGSRVQLSCWSDNTGTGATSVQALATALRDLIEPHHHILVIRDMGRDFETQRYRIDLDVSVWSDRAAFVSPPDLLGLSGDEASNAFILSGDEQTGTDQLELSDA